MAHRTLFYYDEESNVTCVRDPENWAEEWYTDD